MPQLTPSQARVVDPVLTQVAQGYTNAESIGMNLFPSVPVGQRGGKLISFGREDFALYATARAPGANTRRINFGYSSGTYTLEQHALEGVVPFEDLEEADAVPGIDLASVALAKAQAVISLRLEYAQAVLATTAGNFPAGNKVTLAGVNQWSDYTGTSDPASDIETGKEAIRAKVGRRPNTLVVGPTVWAKLRNHPKLTDRIKYTGRDGLTQEMVAQLFGVDRVLVGDMIYDNAGTFTDVWGKFAVLAYTVTGSLASRGTPTFGYTYRLNGYPLVEQAYEDRNAKSWVYPITDEVAPVIASSTSGYLISAAVA